MKYKIWEKLLTEYVGSPTEKMIDEVEANSFEEAYKLAKSRNPNLGAMKIEEKEKSMEYDS